MPPKVKSTEQLFQINSLLSTLTSHLSATYWRPQDVTPFFSYRHLRRLTLHTVNRYAWRCPNEKRGYLSFALEWFIKGKKCLYIVKILKIQTNKVFYGYTYKSTLRSSMFCLVADPWFTGTMNLVTVLELSSSQSQSPFHAS